MANTVFHMPGYGETYWAGTSPFTIKVSASDTDGAIGCIELTVQPGGGPELHRHGGEDEFFFVVTGTMTFLGDFGEREVAAGGAFYVPEGTLHAFENRTTEPVRMLSFFLPGGFENYFREVCLPEPMAIPDVAAFRERARTIAAKHNMTFVNVPSPFTPIHDPVIVGPDEGEVLNIMGDKATILVSSEATGNTFCAFIEEALPGAGVPPHVHFREDELFYILEGELMIMKPDGEEVVLTPGGFLYSPKGTPHAWFNRTNRLTRFLCVATPGGFDTFFRHIHDKSDPGEVIATAAGYDIKFLPK